KASGRARIAPRKRDQPERSVEERVLLLGGGIRHGRDPHRRGRHQVRPCRGGSPNNQRAGQRGGSLLWVHFLLRRLGPGREKKGGRHRHFVRRGRALLGWI